MMLYLLAIGYGLCTTAYHGWNLWPGSLAEWVTDGITLVLFAIAWAADHR